ncbi:MAG: hypothetical protein HYZ23_10510 [Chloroflexi bacterium]|nr:hypothetical protein [Chloroflexota bacterium]
MHLTDDQLNEYLDHESTERAQIESHLDSCDECAARLSARQAVFTELDSLPEAALSRNLSEAFLWDAARFQPDRSLIPHPPRWLTLTAILQAATALAALIVAAPLIATLLPVIDISSVTDLSIQLQSQWTMWLDQLSTFNFQLVNLPTFQPASFPTLEMSSLLIALAGASVLWILGNGIFLRKQSPN